MCLQATHSAHVIGTSAAARTAVYTQYFAAVFDLESIVHVCVQGLPYGTMSDDEMRSMGIEQLQDDGVIFMWVTGERLGSRVGSQI